MHEMLLKVALLNLRNANVAMFTRVFSGHDLEWIADRLYESKTDNSTITLETTLPYTLDRVFYHTNTHELTVEYQDRSIMRCVSFRFTSGGSPAGMSVSLGGTRGSISFSDVAYFTDQRIERMRDAEMTIEGIVDLKLDLMRTGVSLMKPHPYIPDSFLRVNHDRVEIASYRGDQRAHNVHGPARFKFPHLLFRGWYQWERHQLQFCIHGKDISSEVWQWVDKSGVKVNYFDPFTFFNDTGKMAFQIDIASKYT